MSRLKIAVIGCGYWGKNLIRNFAELGVLTYVCDANLTQANQFAEQYQVEALSLEDLLQSEVDAVVIAAPAESHYSLAKMALESGKDVFVEKPLALEVAQAEELTELAQHHGRILMVGHLLQYHQAFLTLKNMVSEGQLGRLQYIYSNRLNLGKFRQEENILWSFAPHDISMILSLAGDVPDSVYTTGAAHLNKHIHDVTTTHLSFKSGIKAHVFVSWLHPFKEQKLVVVGDRGMAVFDDGCEWAEKLKFYPHAIDWVNGMPQPQRADYQKIELIPKEPLKSECEHFISAVMQQHQPRTDGHEGTQVLRVLDASQRSLRYGALISLRSEVKNAQQFFVHETSIVDDGCEIGRDTKIWHFSHILKGTKIGRNCTLGQNVMIGPDVTVGDNCKIQNNVSLYRGVNLEDGVFCGPSCVFTNVINPRAEVERKEEFRSTYVERGVTIGANATIICGNTLGAYSLIGAGAVITKNVVPHAVMVGNPAKQIGWVSHSGEILDENLCCPRTNDRYEINSGKLVKLNDQRTSNFSHEK